MLCSSCRFAALSKSMKPALSTTLNSRDIIDLNTVFWKCRVLTNQENDSVEPVVSENEGNNEEGNSEEDSHASDQVDEMVDFLSDGGLSRVQSRSQASNTSHYLDIKIHHLEYFNFLDACIL